MDKIPVLQLGPYPTGDEERLLQRFAVHRYFEADDKTAFIRRHGRELRAIATRGDLGAGRDLIDALPALEIISIYGVGFDAVDLSAARARGIRVTNTPDVLTEDVADLGIAMMLALARGVVGADAWVRSGDWIRMGSYPLQMRVHGKRAGILGLGRIGKAVARRLEGFGMDIAYAATAAKPDAAQWSFIADPVELARRSDILIATLSASEKTRHIVSRQVIEALGPEGLFVNISRAANVDEAALLDALESRLIGGAALDVFAGEPHLNPRFLALDNVLLQPHQGSGTFETRQAMGELVYDNLVAHFDGRDLPSPVL